MTRSWFILFALACSPAEDDDKGLPAEPTACERLELPAVAFQEDGNGTRRGDLAADFTVPVDGVDWTLSQRWTGCESYIVVTDDAVAGGDTYWMNNDIGRLIRRSPPNAHYFFVSNATGDVATTRIELMAQHIRKAIRRLDDGEEVGQQEWWRARLHAVDVPSSELDGWLATAIPANTPQGNPTGPGLAIDREQRVRGVGGHNDVNRFDAGLDWPYEPNYELAANEAIHFNFNWNRQQRLDAEEPTIVEAWSGEIIFDHVAETTVDFPSGAELQAFDTVEVDLSALCPDPDAYEAGNCGAWDYLSHLWLLDEDGETWQEFARFITTYHRAGRYLADVTPLLVLLGDGGPRTVRFDLAPPWNPQPTETWLNFRFTNRDKGYRPVSLEPLWSGGNFNSGYNVDRPVMNIDVPSTTERAEVWALITGHGGAENNCAEFCNHQHEFSANGEATLIEYPAVGVTTACMDAVAEGVVPNQYGTWWFGRGGWCPGQQVDPTIIDVTTQGASGALELSYRGLYEQDTPPDNAGNIVLTSYLIRYE